MKKDELKIAIENKIKKLENEINQYGGTAFGQMQIAISNLYIALSNLHAS